MRRIAIVNQKGGVGKTTTVANLGAALARAGQRVLTVDLDPQGNLSLHLGVEVGPGEPSSYGVLIGQHDVAAAVRPTATPGLEIVPANIDLSGAEMELAGAFGRETLLRDALRAWTSSGSEPDFVLFDCPPSLGLLSVNGLVAASEVFIALQTEFFALQGMSQLVSVVGLIQRRLNPELEVTGIIPCLYDNRLRLAREVLAEIRKYFPEQVFRGTVGTNVKLAEAPSYGQTIFEYAPESAGARDYARLAAEILGAAEVEVPRPAPEKPAAESATGPAQESPGSAASKSGPPGGGPGGGTGGTGGRTGDDANGTGAATAAAREERARRLVRAEDLPPPPAEVFRAPGQ